MATTMISVGDISELIEAFSAAAFVFYMLVFISVLIMRVTHRDQPRLFKVHCTLNHHYTCNIITCSYQHTCTCIIQPCTCDFVLILLLSVSLYFSLSRSPPPSLFSPSRDTSSSPLLYLLSSLLCFLLFFRSFKSLGQRCFLSVLRSLESLSTSFLSWRHLGN